MRASPIPFSLVIKTSLDIHYGTRISSALDVHQGMNTRNDDLFGSTSYAHDSSPWTGSDGIESRM